MSGDHTIDVLGEWVKVLVGSAHEIGLQQVTSRVVVLELALVELHRQIGRLEVQGHHLTAGVPVELERKKKLEERN